MDKTQLIQKAYITCHVLKDDGTFPNNLKYPLLVYKGVFHLHPDDGPSVIKEVFADNNWTNSWENGIYDYHHYHSLTHEAMGILCGRAEVQLGGPNGVCVELIRGDVLIIPAGVAHKCLESSEDFVCIGAYPDGKDYDIKYGKEEERPQADENITKVAMPKKDPVYGNEGPLIENWSV